MKLLKNKSLLIAALAASTLAMSTTSCREEFAEQNTNPSTINKANIPYLLSQSLLDFEPSGYLVWYYSGKYTEQWAQAFTPSGSFSDNFNIMTENGGIGSQRIAIMNIKREIDRVVSEMTEEEASQYKNTQAIVNSLLVYMSMFDSDMYGSETYSEACLARYGGTVTPKYDTQKELFEQWSSTIDDAIATLSGNNGNQASLTNNDFVYGGDAAKWLKFANAVKLKLAVRLVFQDKAKAKKMAEEVGANYAQNVMDGIDDDFIMNKGSQNYHFGDGVSLGVGSKNVIDFLKKNKDPRVRFFYFKNSFNSEVMQAFLDAENNLASGQTLTSGIPKYILENADIQVVDGKKVFKGWKGDGEPWVRYYGIPVGMNLNLDDSYKSDADDANGNYFQSSKWQLSVGDKTKSYSPYSTFNYEMEQGQKDYTYPTKPDGEVYQDKDDMPWYGMYASTAEMNLYLAEFKLLGASLPQSADYYYNKAVEASVAEYDHLAGLNKIPYYDTDQCHVSGEAPIKLVDGEIATLMDKDDIKLTGTDAEKLEKVYIQQYLHFMFQPIDQYVTVRRSGIPKVGSALIPWVELKENTLIPRRYGVTAPTDKDLMKSIVEAAYAEQGFSTGVNDSQKLNSERVWYDKGAPNFGEGCSTLVNMLK